MTVSRITLVLSALFLLLAGSYLAMALNIRMPMLSDVLGPRLLPVALGWLLVGAATAQGVITLQKMRADTDQEHFVATGVFFVALAAMLAAVLLLAFAGYFLFAFAIVFAIFCFAEFMKPLARVAAATAMALLFHAVFVWGLGVPFPKSGFLL